jgi:hypothetical protein
VDLINIVDYLLKFLLEYGLPFDEPEQDRLNLNHTKYYLLLGGKLCLAPIPSDLHKTLDIGCGTGIWCVDFADNFKSAEVSV